MSFRHSFLLLLVGGFTTLAIAQMPSQASLCIDDFCIGQSIKDSHFDSVQWRIPTQEMTSQECTSLACQPEVAFRGYASSEQRALVTAFGSKYGMYNYNVLSSSNLAALRTYHYECNAAARGRWGERRIIGMYHSVPSSYTTIVGLRLVDGELRVYRLVREFPFRNQRELLDLARQVRAKYGSSLLLYDGISSNAPYEVESQKKLGWFARSTPFDTPDPANNLVELVLIDPNTRQLLEPASMVDGGEIKPLPVEIPPQCSRSAIPLN